VTDGGGGGGAWGTENNAVTDGAIGQGL